jgi:hypothetical protein
MWHVAHVPQWLHHVWQKQGIIPGTRAGHDAMRKILNSNEYQWLRVSRGNL